MQKQIDSSDDDDDNSCNENNNAEREGNINNSDDISNSGFSNGSYNEQNGLSNNSKQSDGRESTKQTTDKLLYEDKWQEHGRSDAVALDVPFIKGVLPDLFAILKFLESVMTWFLMG